MAHKMTESEIIEFFERPRREAEARRQALDKELAENRKENQLQRVLERLAERGRQ